MDYPIHVNYQYTNNSYKAKKWLDSLPDVFAADFETASKFTKKQKELIKVKIHTYDLILAKERILLQQLTSDGLSHPSLTVITHLSVAWSDRDAYVIICDTNSIRKLIYTFLTNTRCTQLWHNSTFDFKHIYFHTGLIPPRYTDTQLLAKSLINDADSFKDRTGLKELMGYAYGSWGISKDNFTLEEQWNEDVIRYSATDSVATYKLYTDIQKDLQNEGSTSSIITL